MSDKANLRRFVFTLVVLGLFAPWLARSSQRAIASMFNGPPQWVPATFEYRRNYDWFKQTFRNQDTAVLRFDGCTIDNDQLGEFSRQLFAADDPTEAARRKELFQYAISGVDVLQTLRGNEIGLSERSSLARLRGTFIGPDGKSTCIVVMMTQAGVYARHESLSLVRDTALRAFGIEDHELAIGGATVDGATIDQASVESIKRFSVPSMVVASLFCWWCLRSIIFAGIVFVVALAGQGLVLSLSTFDSNPMNAILIVMPALIYVLTVSAGVHLSHYHGGAMRHDAGDGTVTSRAIRNGLTPCFLATMTTVIGLLSLSVSDMIPIRQFGLLASIAVSVTTLLLFALLPFGMDVQTIRSNRLATQNVADAGKRVSWGFGLLLKLIAKSPAFITVAFLLAMTMLAIGALSLKSSVNIRALFPEDSRILRDYRDLEDNIGPLVPVEVLISFDESSEMPLLKRFELIRDTQVLVSRMEEVGGTMSVATFFPTVPKPGGIRRTASRAALAKRLSQSTTRFANGRFYAKDHGREYWRISARVSALGRIDYGELLGLLQQRIEPFLNEHGDADVQAMYTGALPVAYQAQRALLDDLFRSYLTAFSLVAVVMILVLRNLWAGLLVMLPNLFPTLLLFGSMGWIGVPVNIGSVMTASVALGIAVDDTLHFLVRYRRETAAGCSPEIAVGRCLSHCGRAMIHTSLIVGLGLMLYIQSEFVPTRRFAAMMIGLLAAALVGDLVLLPALLLGKFGRVFRGK